YAIGYFFLMLFFSSRRRHTRLSRDWSSDVCSSDLEVEYNDGHLYIGDFGNNKNGRTDLTILKYAISDKDELSNLELIKFRYAEQIGRASCRERLYIASAAAARNRQHEVARTSSVQR